MHTLSRQIITILFTFILSPHLFAAFGMSPDNQMGKFAWDAMASASNSLNTAADSLSKISSQFGVAQAVSKACVINDQIANELDMIESTLFYFSFDSMTCLPLAKALAVTAKTMKKCEKIFTEGLQPNSMEILNDALKAVGESKQIFTSCKISQPLL